MSISPINASMLMFEAAKIFKNHKLSKIEELFKPCCKAEPGNKSEISIEGGKFLNLKSFLKHYFTEILSHYVLS